MLRLMWPAAYAQRECGLLMKLLQSHFVKHEYTEWMSLQSAAQVAWGLLSACS